MSTITLRVSIHAPRAGSDLWLGLRSGSPFVSIHAPRAGSDAKVAIPCQPSVSFNPRSPRGERRQLRDAEVFDGAVSIHAPRAGSDAGVDKAEVGCFQFQSTLPARGATPCGLGKGRQ